MCLRHGSRHHAVWSPSWPYMHFDTITSSTLPSQRLCMSLDNVDTTWKSTPIGKTKLLRCPLSSSAQPQMFRSMRLAYDSHHLHQALLMEHIMSNQHHIKEDDSRRWCVLVAMSSNKPMQCLSCVSRIPLWNEHGPPNKKEAPTGDNNPTRTSHDRLGTEPPLPTTTSPATQPPPSHPNAATVQNAVLSTTTQWLGISKPRQSTWCARNHQQGWWWYLWSKVITIRQWLQKVVLTLWLLNYEWLSSHH